MNKIIKNKTTKILIYCILIAVTITNMDAFAQKWKDQYDYVDSFSKGLAGVKKDGKLFYINKKSERVE